MPQTNLFNYSEKQKFITFWNGKKVKRSSLERQKKQFLELGGDY